MKVNPNIFRGYDLRGVVGDDLSEALYEHLGRAYATFLIREKLDDTVIIARDARETGETYSKAISKGIIDSGLNVIDIGLTFVGTFYWSQYHLNHKGGVMVTASHNPKNYNGAKFSVDYSETMVSHQIQELRHLVESEEYEKINGKGSYKKIDIKDDYIKFLHEKINIDSHIRVLIDTSYSTGGAIVPHVMNSFENIELVEKHTKVDSSFPLGAPDPTETELAERLSREVIENKCDVGFCYDSDGDRIGIVDEKGGIIWNDILVAIFAVDILKRHPGSTIMFNSLCSRAVPETIERHGGKPFMWRTGHSFLKKKNQEVGAAFIGELSGHFFFSKDYYNHDDGIYASLRLISYLASSDKSLSQLVETLPNYHSSPEIKVGYPDDKKVEMVEDLAKRIKIENPDATVIDDERMGDGVRFETDSSMFVVRYSQNGPYLTVKIEANTEEEYERIRKYLARLISEYKDIDWSFGVSQHLLKHK